MGIVAFAFGAVRACWRTSLLVAAAASLATAILAGALMAGDSIRLSLDAMLAQSAGRASYAISAPRFFRDSLAVDVGRAGAWPAAPVIVLDGEAIPAGGSPVPAVVYGVDSRFWSFHGVDDPGLSGERALLSPAVARELGPEAGGLTVRVQVPPVVPPEWLFGPKRPEIAELRIDGRATLPSNRMGDFSLYPNEAGVRAVFVPLETLQRELEQEGRANTILLSTGGRKGESRSIAQALRERATPQDLGLRVEELAGGTFSIEADTVILPDPLVREIGSAAASLAVPLSPVLSYIAEELRNGDAAAPWAFVAAVDPEMMPVDPEQIVLDDVTAKELRVRAGDQVTVAYPLWQDGRAIRKSASFTVQRIVPKKGLFADAELTPAHEGIAEAASMREWEPPFPFDPSVIRPSDEAYWKRYGPTPRAFVNLATGQKLWGTRFGSVTSLRTSMKTRVTEGENTLNAFFLAVQAHATPDALGFHIHPVRTSGVDPARTPSDWFLYFSILPVAAALILATVLFRLAVWRRVDELRNRHGRGWTRRRLRAGLVAMGALLAAAGAAVGIALAPLYLRALLLGLDRWWPHAVSDIEVAPFVLPSTAINGALAGFASAWLFFALESRVPRFERSPLPRVRLWRLRLPVLRSRRSLTAVALLAAGAFALIGAESLRRPPASRAGFNVIVETRAPVLYNPADPEGRRMLKLREGPVWHAFRVREGEDVSRLNLYRPQTPRVVGAPPSFLEARGNRAPWSRLDGRLPDGSIPAVVDSASLSQVLHIRVGDTLLFNAASDQPVKVHIAGAIRDPVLQGEAIVSSANFASAFPFSEGYRLFLVDAPDPQATVREAVSALAAYGATAEPAAERARRYLEIDESYVAMFQTLGGFGMVIASFGFAAAVLRVAEQRRREWRLIRALGGRPGAMLAAQTAFELAAGLGAGALAGLALLAPSALRGQAPYRLLWLAALFSIVVAVGTASAAAAAWWAGRPRDSAD